MKMILTLCLSLMAFSAHAQMSPEQMQKMMQQYGNMDPAKIQAQAAEMQKNMPKMMQHAEEMQKCVGNIGQDKMDAMEAKGKAINAKIESLCAAGQESAAEQYAIKQGMAMQSDPTILALKKCSGDMMAMVNQQFNFMPPTGGETRKSICEG